VFDGAFFQSTGTGAGYGSPFGNGDVIGCGITGDRKLFYTLNGKFLGLTGAVVRENMSFSSVVGIRGHIATVSLCYDNFVYSDNPSTEWKFNANAVRLLFANEKFVAQLKNLVDKDSRCESVGALMNALKAVDEEHYNRVVETTPTLAHLSCSQFLHEVFGVPFEESAFAEASENLMSSIVVQGAKEEEQNNEPHIQAIEESLFDSVVISEDEPGYQTEEALFVFVCAHDDLVRVLLRGNISLSYLNERLRSQLPPTVTFTSVFYNSGETKKYLRNTSDIVEFFNFPLEELPILLLE
jgi:hypothetical protein